MATAEALDLSTLYERDETAWLEAMSALAANGRHTEMDFAHLSEYLADMAKRDRREVFSRLVVLLSHLLKWEHQLENRSNSWRGTILEQRRELRLLLESRSLRRHADRSAVVLRFDCLPRIADQIDQHLLQLSRIAHHVR